MKTSLKLRAAALVGVAALIGCGQPKFETSMTGDDGTGPTGHWIQQSGDQETRALFYKDGELAWVDNRGDVSGSWKEPAKGSLEIQLGERTLEASYNRVGDRMTLDIKPNGPNYQFKKESSQ